MADTDFWKAYPSPGHTPHWSCVTPSFSAFAKLECVLPTLIMPFSLLAEAQLFWLLHPSFPLALCFFQCHVDFRKLPLGQRWPSRWRGFTTPTLAQFISSSSWFPSDSYLMLSLGAFRLGWQVVLARGQAPEMGLCQAALQRETCLQPEFSWWAHHMAFIIKYCKSNTSHSIYKCKPHGQAL